MTDVFAWIGVDAEPGDEERLAAIYEGLGLPPDGKGLDHVLRIHAKMPATLRQHLDFYRGILRTKGPLTRAECEIVGVAVSHRNGCHY